MIIKVRKYPAFLTFIDFLLTPGMRLISGAWSESPQETHAWQLQFVPHNTEIDFSKSVEVSGTYQGYLKKSQGGVLFHFPVLGGWKEYIVLQAEITNSNWHIGWVVKDDGGIKNFQINRLPLHYAQVRVLKTPAGTQALFFAVTDDGEQIPLSKVGEGKVGDGQFARIRLL